MLIIFDLNYLYECLLFQGMVTFWLIGLSGIAGDVCIDFTKKKSNNYIVFTGKKMYNYFFLMFQGGGTTVVTEETKSDVKSSS